jgi:hypothetical protein
MKAGQLKVTIIATGFNGSSLKGAGNSPLSNLFNTASERKQPELLINRKEEKEDMDEPRPRVKQELPKKSDVWDIPTFWRKKKK